MITPIMSIKNLSKTFKTPDNKFETVLKAVSLEIYKDSFIAILGESGSGKSTLFNLMGGLDVLPDDIDNINNGIWFEGSRINFNDKRSVKILRTNIGMILQKYGLVGSLNAEYNIIAKMVYQGMPFNPSREYAIKLLKYIGLSNKRKYLPHQLSGGQQQRVGIARAIAGQPKIILADEPTGNLDRTNTDQIMKLLKKINESGISIILVTHEENLAYQYCSKIYRLNDGVLSVEK